MGSLRKKIIILAVCSVLLTTAAISVISIFLIHHDERRESEQLLWLLCEIGERNLDYYFNSVQDSVEKVAKFVEDDLDGLENEKLAAHIGRAEKYFEELTYKTSGVLTYYYRIDPEISENVKGFWYTNLDGSGFEPHEVTDISQYDTKDTSKLVWFTIPKQIGKSIWLPPYLTENLDVRVISYNVPIKWKGQFVGVVGIEIDYSAMAKQVESIRIGANGYAFLNDAQGNLFYHRDIEAPVNAGENTLIAPEGLLDNKTFVKYTYKGVEKQAAWIELSNKMRLTVSVPVSELEEERQIISGSVVTVSIITLLVVGTASVLICVHLTNPLIRFTKDEENEKSKT